MGGRKSPYTIGIPARITLLDLPRESELQQELNVGLDKQVIDKIQKRRSNIENLVLDEMRRSDLAGPGSDTSDKRRILVAFDLDCYDPAGRW